MLEYFIFSPFLNLKCLESQVVGFRVKTRHSKFGRRSPMKNLFLSDAKYEIKALIKLKLSSIRENDIRLDAKTNVILRCNPFTKVKTTFYIFWSLL